MGRPAQWAAPVAQSCFSKRTHLRPRGRDLGGTARTAFADGWPTSFRGGGAILSAREAVVRHVRTSKESYPPRPKDMGHPSWSNRVGEAHG